MSSRKRKPLAPQKCSTEDNNSDLDSSSNNNSADVHRCGRCTEVFTDIEEFIVHKKIHCPKVPVCNVSEAAQEPVHILKPPDRPKESVSEHRSQPDSAKDLQDSDSGGLKPQVDVNSNAGTRPSETDDAMYAAMLQHFLASGMNAAQQRSMMPESQGVPDMKTMVENIGQQTEENMQLLRSLSAAFMMNSAPVNMFGQQPPLINPAMLLAAMQHQQTNPTSMQAIQQACQATLSLNTSMSYGQMPSVNDKAMAAVEDVMDETEEPRQIQGESAYEEMGHMIEKVEVSAQQPMHYSPTRNPPRPHRCTLCNHSFSKKENITVHMHVKHPEYVRYINDDSKSVQDDTSVGCVTATITATRPSSVPSFDKYSSPFRPRSFSNPEEVSKPADPRRFRSLIDLSRSTCIGGSDSYGELNIDTDSIQNGIQEDDAGDATPPYMDESDTALYGAESALGMSFPYNFMSNANRPGSGPFGMMSAANLNMRSQSLTSTMASLPGRNSLFNNSLLHQMQSPGTNSLPQSVPDFMTSRMPGIQRDNGGCFPGSFESRVSFEQDASMNMSDDAWEEYMDIQNTNEKETLIRLFPQTKNVTPTDPNECTVCNRVLSCKSALQMHYRTHTGERPFKCRLCGRSFTTKGNLKTHMGVHRMKPVMRSAHTCHICKRRFSNSIVLQQHIKMHHCEMPLQPSLNSFTAAKAALANSSVASAMLMSQIRQKAVESMATMNSPVDLSCAAIGSDAVESDTQECDVNVDAVQEELIDDSEPPIDNDMRGEEDSVISETESLSIDVKSEPGLAQQNSPQMFSTFPNLKLPENPFKAIYQPTANERMLLKGRPNTTCSICFKTFACNSALEIHMRSHTKEKPFLCDVCDRGFSTKGNMKQHLLTHKTSQIPTGLGMSSSHSDSGRPSVKEYQMMSSSCSQDGAKSAEMEARNSEIEEMTPTTPSVTHCDSVVKTEKVELHYQEKDPNRSDDFGDLESSTPKYRRMTSPQVTEESSIDLPDSKLATPTESEPDFDALSPLESIREMYVRTTDVPPQRRPPNVMKHQCYVCFKTFSSGSALQIHMRTHTGVRPFRCEICDRAFTTKGNLKVHMSTHEVFTPKRRTDLPYHSPLTSSSIPTTSTTPLMGLNMMPYNNFSSIDAINANKNLTNGSHNSATAQHIFDLMRNQQASPSQSELENKSPSDNALSSSDDAAADAPSSQSTNSLSTKTTPGLGQLPGLNGIKFPMFPFQMGNFAPGGYFPSMPGFPLSSPLAIPPQLLMNIMSRMCPLCHCEVENQEKLKEHVKLVHMKDDISSGNPDKFDISLS